MEDLHTGNEYNQGSRVERKGYIFNQIHECMHTLSSDSLMTEMRREVSEWSKGMVEEKRTKTHRMGVKQIAGVGN